MNGPAGGSEPGRPGTVTADDTARTAEVVGEFCSHQTEAVLAALSDLPRTDVCKAVECFGFRLLLCEPTAPAMAATIREAVAELKTWKPRQKCAAPAGNAPAPADAAPAQAPVAPAPPAPKADGREGKATIIRPTSRYTIDCLAVRGALPAFPSPAAYAVFRGLLVFAFNREHPDRAWPSICRLCNASGGMSERAVRSNLRRLERAGFIRALRRGGIRGEEKTATEYQLLLPDGGTGCPLIYKAAPADDGGTGCPGMGARESTDGGTGCRRPGHGVPPNSEGNLQGKEKGEAGDPPAIENLSLENRLRAALPFNVDADTWLAYVRQKNPKATEAEIAAAVDRLAAAKRDNERLRVSADTLAEYTRKIHVGQWRATA